MNWIFLALAGSFEVVGVYGMNRIKKTKNWLSFVIVSVAMTCSFLFLTLAMRSISMGTAYAIWTGVGTVGGTLVGMFLFGESRSKSRILFISMILFAAVGLKLIS
ncbi:DMT family transporter [Paenibacillus eucommiae]|uniref:Paired small multidrug resistance pump n=1 Tax=Paenibacillus eucommiae TaxID=1355755 RepID=A0ABS4IZ52_9BACL|nr:multidrug efflux SMR transporter [Paenibacillus eucommiae]MBP1992856.1 paired small multidrug resistance pump [Paenibacillus eucommiae]